MSSVTCVLTICLSESFSTFKLSFPVRFLRHSIDASFARSSFSDLSSSAPCLASRMCSRACCHPINAYRTRHFAVAPVLVALLSLSVSLSAVGRSVATNQTLRNCLFATCLSIYLSAVRDHPHMTYPNFVYSPLPLSLSHTQQRNPLCLLSAFEVHSPQPTVDVICVCSITELQIPLSLSTIRWSFFMALIWTESLARLTVCWVRRIHSEN